MEINKIKYFGEATASYLIEKCKATFALITHKHTAEEVGADPAGSASAALALANEYTDEQLATITTGDVVVKESEHSSAADTATNATNAENAVNAEHATSADTATSADSATKAEQDGNGNVIADTYALKAEAVLTVEQELTDEQKDQARANINAGANIIKPLKYYSRTVASNGTSIMLRVNIEEMEVGAVYGVEDITGITNYLIYFDIICDDGTVKTIKGYTGNISGYTYKTVYRNDILIFYSENTSYEIDLSDKSTKDNVVVTENHNALYLGVNNSTEFIPTGDYNPATKKYVDDSVTALSDSAVLTTEQTLTDEQKAQARANINQYDWKTFSDDWGTYTYSLSNQNNYLDYDIAQTINNTSGNGTVSALEDIVSCIPLKNDNTISKSFSLTGIRWVIDNYEALKNGGAFKPSGGMIVLSFPKKRAVSSELDLEHIEMEIIIQRLSLKEERNYYSTHSIFWYGNHCYSQVFFDLDSNTITHQESRYIGVEKNLTLSGRAADAKVVGDALALKADASSVLATANENSATESYSPAADTDLATKGYLNTLIATDDEILEMLTQHDMLPVVADSDGSFLADEDGNILLW